jgi:cysteine-rich repeat protein
MTMRHSKHSRRRLVAFATAACSAALACSPEPQTGTNTNWACKVDADCVRLSATATCEQGFCVAGPGSPDSGPPREASSTERPDGQAPLSNPDAVGPGVNDARSCGDTRVTGTEECDPPDPDNGCGSDCRYICKSDDPTRDCTPVDKCNGQSSCDESKHLCSPSTPLGDYTPCGPNNTMQCIGGVCSNCGDTLVQANEGEECDDGDRNDEDGCDHDCKFSCVAGDPTRDCRSNDPCYADGICDGVTHTCSPKQPAQAGKGCGSGTNCIAGTCVPIRCGDGVTAAGVEACDDGNRNDKDACTNDCKVGCTDAATDCKDVSTCSVASCVDELCSLGPNTAKEGQPCSTAGGSGVCRAGACTSGTCGNSVVDSGEQCDLGPGRNLPGSGCEPTCLYSCQGDPDCTDGDFCTGNETCTTVTGGTSIAKKCTAGTPRNDGEICGSGSICLTKDGKTGCALSTCGDGYTDRTANEECDPPNTTGCDSSCKGKTPCNVEGTWGMKLTIDVSWGDIAGTLAPHSGQVQRWSILTLSRSASNPTEFTTSNVRVCGVEIPDFQTASIAGHEWQGITFANSAIWDSPQMPVFSGTGRVNNLFAGASIDFDSMAILTGVSLKNPSGTWPADQATLLNGTDGSFLDYDGDGSPGVTLACKTGALPMTPYYQPPPNDGSPTYDYPVVNLGDGANPATYGRADKIYAGMRTLSSESGRLDTCDAANGKATVAAFDTHVPGCHTAACTVSGCTSPAAGGECTAGDFGAADATRPVYTVTNATFTARRLSGAAPNCATVRTNIP